MLKFNIKVFYVMGKALAGELSICEHVLFYVKVLIREGQIN